MFHVNGRVLFIGVLRNVYSRGEGVGVLGGWAVAGFNGRSVGRSVFMTVSKIALGSIVLRSLRWCGYGISLLY